MTPVDSIAIPTTLIWHELEAFLGSLTNDQKHLLDLSHGKGYTVSNIKQTLDALELPNTVDENEYYSLGKLFEFAVSYLREIEGSASVQRKLLPDHPPKLEGLDIAVKYIPMVGVSGDYYDFLPLSERKIGIAMGDVCGKGISAAMLMACVRTALHAHIQVEPNAVGELMSYLNKVIKQDSPDNRFVTLVYGILDAKSHTFSYSVAGHPPVLHYRSVTKDVCKLDIGGSLLGIKDDTEYPVETVTLDKGDDLILYTDGIIEASDATDELYGLDRLCDMVAIHGAEPAESLQDSILSDISSFANKTWEDDVTMITTKIV
jgi:phosphoserine phosphatase RsbU/P